MSARVATPSNATGVHVEFTCRLCGAVALTVRGECKVCRRDHSAVGKVRARIRKEEGTLREQLRRAVGDEVYEEHCGEVDR